MVSKFISQDGYDFTVDIDGQQFSATIPKGMEETPDKAIDSFVIGKEKELVEAAIVVVDCSYKTNDIINESK